MLKFWKNGTTSFLPTFFHGIVLASTYCKEPFCKKITVKIEIGPNYCSQHQHYHRYYLRRFRVTLKGFSNDDLAVGSSWTGRRGWWNTSYKQTDWNMQFSWHKIQLNITQHKQIGWREGRWSHNKGLKTLSTYLMVTQASFLGRLGDLLRSVPCSSDAISRSLKSEMATWFSIFTLHPSLDNPSPSTFLLCDATTPCHWQTRRAHGGSIHPSAPSRVACRVAATSYYILQICLT